MSEPRRDFHILNGDALKDQLNDDLKGEIIVCREVLMDGPVSAEKLVDFFIDRAAYLEHEFGKNSKINYFEEVIPEFEKIIGIPNGSNVYLWFEDDLFCQVNFWFVSYLLANHSPESACYLIRPQEHTRYGFGGLDKLALKKVYNHKILLDNLHNIADLWLAYRADNIEDLWMNGNKIADQYPFILPSIEAHLGRIPSENHPGHHIYTLTKIIREIGGDEFGPIFKEFSKRVPIYGYGDLQVKKLIKDIIQEKA